MTRTFTLPAVSVEDAQARITDHLAKAFQSVRRNDSSSQVQITVPAVISELLKELSEEDRPKNPVQVMTSSIFDPGPNSGPFYEAAWDLCRKGILYPSLQWGQRGSTEFQGHLFTLTSYGEQWIEELTGYESIPAQHGRFSSLLASHAQRFGPGYHARSQEALSCYRAHTYLACCAMCGAAAESILLSLAIARTGDEAAVLRDYRTARGRTNLENMLARNQNSHVQSQLAAYTALLNYWRDEASHGAASTIDEEEAFMAMLNLLRFARFADSRWAELTSH
jgi:hypothetical protein